MEQDPLHHEVVDDIYRENIQRLVERGTWTKPFYEHEGCRFQPGGEEDASWEDLKAIGAPWVEE